MSANKKSGLSPIVRALCWYVASLLVLCFGMIMSARYYPGGFDWRYKVASALASQKHNPAASVWFAGALSLAMVLLLPYVSALKKGLSPSLSAAAKLAITALRTGIICAALLGLERLLIRDLSDLVFKAHEILGFFAFLGLYFGILSLLGKAMLRQRIYAFPAFMVVSPLLAIGITHFWLYLAQREIGWVDTSWKELGTPVLLSYAFWEWLAIGFLWIGLGMLSFTCIKRGAQSNN
jgi:hypothetical protein